MQIFDGIIFVRSLKMYLDGNIWRLSGQLGMYLDGDIVTLDGVANIPHLPFTHDTTIPHGSSE